MLQTVVKCAAIAAMLAAASCGPRPGAAVAERVSENTYRNQAFGVTVTAPDGWFVLDNDQTRKMMDLGAEAAGADDKRLKAALKASMQQSNTLFTFFEHPPGAPVEFNPSVVGTTENLRIAPGVKTGRDYFFHVRKLLEQSAIETHVADGYTSRKIGGRDFDQMDVTMAVNGVKVQQSYYAAIHDGFAVAFVQSYNTDAQRSATGAVLDSIRLDW